MKYCPACKQNKPFDCFYKDKSRASGYSNYCKTCKLAYIKVYNKSKNSKHLSKHRLIKNRLKGIEYLGNCCVDCKKTYPPICYDFHHIDPMTKEYTLSEIRHFSWDRFKLELDKCILLCSNCHRLRHA